MPSGLSLEFNFTDFHSFWSASTSDEGGGECAGEGKMSETDEALEDVLVFECE
jgi:hypothetical protein